MCGSGHIVSEVSDFDAICQSKIGGRTRGKGLRIQRTMFCHKCGREFGNNYTLCRHYGTLKWREQDGVLCATKAEEGLPTSDFRLPTSNFRLQTSDFRLPTSDFQLPTSNFRLPTSDFRLPTSDFRLPTSGFRLPTFGLGEKNMQGTLLWGFSDSNTEAQIVVASVLKMAGFGGLRVFEAYLYLPSLLTWYIYWQSSQQIMVFWFFVGIVKG